MRALSIFGYLKLAQAFKLPQEPGDGAEMFSLMRESDLPDEAYLTAKRVSICAFWAGLS